MALMRFTGASIDDGVNERRIVCGGWRRWQFESDEAMERRTSSPRYFGLDGRGTRLSIGGGRMRPPLREHDYRLAAGTLAASGVLGIVVTRPCVPVACAGPAAAAGAPH